MKNGYVAGRILSGYRLEMIKLSPEDGFLDYGDVQVLDMQEMSKEELIKIMSTQLNHQRDYIEHLEDKLLGGPDNGYEMDSHEELICLAMAEAAEQKHFH